MLELIVELSGMNAAVIGKMVGDVPAGRMCWQGENVPNHPAWQLGHLTFVRTAVSAALGRPVPGLEGAGWVERCGPGSTPVGDAGAYPGKAELVDVFGRAQAHVVEVLKGADWEKLGGPNPVEQLRDKLPTGRHFVTYLLTVHDGWHIGQLGDWRRAAGLPRVL